MLAKPISATRIHGVHIIITITFCLDKYESVLTHSILATTIVVGKNML